MKYISIILLLVSANVEAQQLKLASGKADRYANFASQYVDARNVDVWLPDGYTKEKKYAVLYMHDGQMLFDSTTTWNHQEWGIDEIMGRLISEKKLRDCIVVAVWNNGIKRAAEYFPERALTYLDQEHHEIITPMIQAAGKPLADNYLKFLVTELKPFVDSVYSTYKDPANTFIMGSSMGGLISMYAICEYPNIFGGAACLSTHWTGIFTANNNPVPAALVAYMKDHLPSAEDHKIYFDHGTKTLDSLYGPFQEMADRTMKAKGYSPKNWMSKVFEGEDHSERAWNKRLDVPAIFLLKP